MARLQQTCSICERRYHKMVDTIKNDRKIPEQLLEVSINAIQKPKPVTVERESSVGSNVLLKYSCSHSVLIPKLKYDEIKAESEGYTSLTKGFHSFDYQTEGVKFALESGLNCLIADEMGLGKTAQALLAIRESGVSPTIFTVKSATIYQWVKEFKEWATLEPLGILPILSSKNAFIPGFKAYLVSHDLLPDVADKLIALQPKAIVADEVQAFKNPSSKRSKALIKICHEANIQHKIFLSGTPIKNRASEYFTVLNLLAPGYFPSFGHFAIRWLEPNSKGVLTKIRHYAIDDFRRLTAKWVIRREVADVQKDLPPLRVTTQEIKIDDPIIKNSYNQQLDLFDNFLNHGGKINAIEILGWLAKLRRLTALAKLPETIELVKDFLDSTEDQKVAIGIHHKSVKDQLFYALEPYGAVTLSGEDSAERKNFIIQQFQSSAKRVLIINEISGGTGLDGLQCCNNVFTLERQWNSADEDQFIKRFLRTGQTKPVLNTILMAHGTIDTQFHEWVESKREICKQTYGTDYNPESDSDGLKDFARQVIGQRI